MVKNMKKLICSLLSVALILLCVPSAKASSAPNGNANADLVELPTWQLAKLNVGDSITLDDGAVLKKISYCDYSKGASRNNGIAINKNVAYDDPYVGYYNYSKEFGLDGTSTCKYKALLQATIKIWCNGSNAEIEDVVSVYTTASAGEYNYEWIQSAAYSDPRGGDKSSFPRASVKLFGDGQFKVTTQNSSQGSVDLAGLGFSRAYSTSNIWYSKTLHMRSSYFFGK